MFSTSSDHLRQGKLNDLFSLLEAELVALGIGFYLIGAIARDVWLTAQHEIAPVRVTRDLDLAVWITDQKQYALLKERLIATGRFLASRDNAYTLIFEDQRPVDLLPFGELAMEGAVQVAGTGLTTIRVDGFQEVYEAGTAQVQLDNFVFRVCTLPGIVILKLIAYDDRPELRVKDVQDIGQIITHYFSIEEDAVYEHHNDLFDDPDFTVEKTAARVLGRQMYSIVGRSELLLERIKRILVSQIEAGEQSRVVEHLTTGTRRTLNDSLDLLRYLYRGLTDASHTD